MLTKQAKTLSDAQVKAVMGFLSSSRNALRNQVMFTLSLHGLRSKEIAELEISMITDSEGQLAKEINLADRASKGRSGRVIPVSKGLYELLGQYLEKRESQSTYLITTERAEKFSANAVAVWFKRLYSKLGYQGCSSHSGRRTFITNCARKVSLAGGSIRDVMALAGHKNLQTTQRYVDANSEAQQKLIQMIF